MGTKTIAFDHDTDNLSSILNEIQHDYHNVIISNMYAHLNSNDCIEVVMAKGKDERIREFVDRIINTEGVEHEP